MDLLERFRRRLRPDDAQLTPETVRQLDDPQRLLDIALSHSDSRVRRAATRRLKSPEALTPLVDDPDLEVRDEALRILASFAAGEDGSVAIAALAALKESRQLVFLARSAALPQVRRSALERITGGRHLATLAKTATDPTVRTAAFERVGEADLILDVALRSEHRDTALSAVERLEEPADLQSVASRARQKAAARRAQARLDAHKAPSEPESPTNAIGEVPVAVTPEETLVFTPPPPEPAKEEERADELPPDEPPAAQTPPVVEAAPETNSELVIEASAAPLAALAAEEAPSEVPPPAPEADPAPAPPESQEHKEHVARLEALAARLENLTQRKDLLLRDADAALREARAEPLATAPARLARRIKVARTALFSRSQDLHEVDEWQRWGNATAQEELCRRMEALEGRKDFDRVAHEIREIDARWADFRLAPRDEAAALRQRYQKARSAIKTQVDAYFAKRAEAAAEALKQKDEICARAEALADSTDWLKTAEELKGLQARWKALAPTSRREGQALWERFRRACDKFFVRRQEDLARRKEEWSSNLQKKQALCVRVEELAGSSEWEATAAEVRKAQAEWKKVGPVPKDKSDALWQRFRSASDSFFERYKSRHELDLATRVAEREAVVVELEALSGGNHEDLASKAQGLLMRLRQMSPLPPPHEEALTGRALRAREGILVSHPDAFRGTELDPNVNRSKREKLCARVESLVRPKADPADSTTELARRLKEALAANSMGTATDTEARQREARSQVEAAKATWSRLGPVPGEDGKALEERFRKACDLVLAQSTPRR